MFSKEGKPRAVFVKTEKLFGLVRDQTTADLVREEGEVARGRGRSIGGKWKGRKKTGKPLGQ